MKSTLCCLEHIPKHWVNDTFGLLGYTEGSIQGFCQNFIKVSSLYTLMGRQPFPSITFIVNSILMLLHLEIVSGCTTLIG
jgi:hypothetical protein